MEKLEKLDLIWEQLIEVVPEVKENPKELVQYIYDRVSSVYSEDEDKYLRFYYVGYILTAEDDAMSGEEITISNITIANKGDYKITNPYYIKLKRLLDIKNISKETLESKVSILTY